MGMVKSWLVEALVWRLDWTRSAAEMRTDRRRLASRVCIRGCLKRLARRTIALRSIRRRRWPVVRPENSSSRSVRRVGAAAMRQRRRRREMICELSDHGSNHECDACGSALLCCDVYSE